LQADFTPCVSSFWNKIYSSAVYLKNLKHAELSEDGIRLKTFNQEINDKKVLPFGSTGGFYLWRNSKLGYRTETGTGIPGWHDECAVMIKETFKGPVDLHMGGKDLAFPHHANEEMLFQLKHNCSVTKF
jgi:cysteinyl-tRNA synthetase